MPPDPGELPQWVYGLSAIGLIIGGVVVRFGWIKGAEPASEEPARIMGAVVDNRAVSDLAVAVEAHTAVAKASAETIERAADKISDEMRNLGDEIRRLGNKLER